MSSHSQGCDVVFVYYDTFDMMACVMDYWPTVLCEYSKKVHFEGSSLCSVLFFLCTCLRCQVPFFYAIDI